MITARPAPTASTARRRGAWAVAAMVAAVGATTAASATATPADPQAQYVTLFGDEERAVLATPATRDDAAFAAKLLTRAADLTDDPELQRFVYDRAAALARKDADGLDTAVEATRLLADGSPVGPDRQAWQAKLLDLRQAQYKRVTGAKRIEVGTALAAELAADADAAAARGQYAEAVRRLKDAQGVAQAIRSPKADELAAAVKAAQARQQTADRLDKLRQRLDARGGDVAALEQVILGYLLELDDVRTAATLAAGHPDPAWARAIALAADPTKELAEDDLLSLAAFYRRAAEKAPADRAPGADKAATTDRASATDKARPVVRLAAAERAYELLNRYLKGHARQDAAKVKAQQDADAVVALMDTLPGGRRSTVVVWNTYHGNDHTVGAAEVNVVLGQNGKVVWRQDRVPIDWVPGKDTSVSFEVDRAFDAVRVEVTRWHQTAGGLSEVQVFRHRVNVAAGKPVTASGSHPGPFAPATLTDGVTTSAAYGKGYWVLPDAKPGWAEVSLK